ncbi:MAG: VWA domain-containing protein [Acidobacteriota bacterium]
MRKYLIFSILFLNIFLFSQELGKIQEKVEVRLILVPTVVTDKKGNFIERLKIEDFEVYEDGKRQYISLFYLEKIKDSKLIFEDNTDEKKSISREQYELRQSFPPRTIILIFDQITTSPFYVTRLEEPLKKFLKNFITHDDNLLIYIGGKSYLFKKGRIFISEKEPDSVSKIIKKVLKESFYPIDFIYFSSSPEKLPMAEMERDVVFPLLNMEFKMLSLRGLRRLKLIAEELKRIEGEKRVIFLSEGYGNFFSGRLGEDAYSTHELNDPAFLAKYFNDSNTAIYSLDIGGLKDYNFMYRDLQMTASQREKHQNLFNPFFRQSFLRDLSSRTGGEAITNTNDLGEALQIIGDMISKAYILGYSSTNKIMDGKYRKIKVKVRMKKVIVKHREGYFAKD